MMSRMDGEDSGLGRHRDAAADSRIDPDARLAQIDSQQAKRIFASKLQAAMDAKGWNQSELAIQASKFLPKGKRIGRDNVSNYINRKHRPGRIFLMALANALGVEPGDLCPNVDGPKSSDPAPELDFRDLGDGHVFLRINKRLPFKAVLRILEHTYDEA